MHSRKYSIVHGGIHVVNLNLVFPGAGVERKREREMDRETQKVREGEGGGTGSKGREEGWRRQSEG